MVAVHSLHLHSHTADCWLVSEGIEQEVKVTLPTGRLQPITAPKLQRKDRKLLKSSASKAVQSTVSNMKSDSFREAHRMLQLRSSLNKEIHQTLKSTSFEKTSNLGPVNFEFDFSLFDFSLPDNKSVTYSYENQNMSQLDRLMGPKWDIKIIDNGVNFVTSVRIRITPDFQLSISVKAATAMLNIDSDNHHRQQIAAFMGNRSVPDKEKK